MAATESRATLKTAVAAMQKFVGVSKGVADCGGASEGAGKEVLSGKAVACWERGGEPTAPLPGRNKGDESASSCAVVFVIASAAATPVEVTKGPTRVIGLRNNMLMWIIMVYCML